MSGLGRACFGSYVRGSIFQGIGMDLQNSLLLSKLSEYRALIALLIVAAGGYYFLHDYLSLETLRKHRATLLIFRDSNYSVAVMTFVLAYTLFVAFSFPFRPGRVPAPSPFRFLFIPTAFRTRRLLFVSF